MKNLLFSSVLLLSSTVALAQLFVRPTPGGSSIDSYVYVKNEILYVTQDVNLQKNAAGDTEASIYLRNGGQLIQGGTTSINKGNGFLSVQQNTKPTNAYAYYYWCSPVGNSAINPAVGNTNFGIGAIYEDKNTLVGEGTKAALSTNIREREGFSNPLTISRRWTYIHPNPGTEAANDYVRIENYNNVPAGYGFTMKGVNEGTASSNTANITLDQTYEFRGRPNNGDFSIPVAGPSGSEAMMTLTGNPYPSALDLNKIFFEPGNESLSSIYFYDEDRSVMSHLYSQKPFGYGVWVPLAEDTSLDGNPAAFPGAYTRAAFYIWNQGGSQIGSSSNSSANNNNKRYAPIGQGFMFVGNSTGNVSIKNSHRVFKTEGAGNYSVFQRPEMENGDNLSLSMENYHTTSGGPTFSTNPNQIDNRMAQLRLYVVFDNALTRDLLLGFSPQATDGYDRGLDGLSPLGMSSDAYFPINSNSERKPYAIQSTNFDPSKQIPITFTLHKTSRIEVRAVEEIRKPYEKAYLYDSQENTYRPLVRAHSLAGTFTLPAGTYNDRFYIVFRSRGPRPQGSDETMDTQTRVTADVGLFQDNIAQQLQVSNPEGYSLKSAYVYDMSGKLVISEENLGDNHSYSFYTGNLSDGVYMVKLITADDIVIDYKAMVLNK